MAQWQQTSTCTNTDHKLIALFYIATHNTKIIQNYSRRQSELGPKIPRPAPSGPMPASWPSPTDPALWLLKQSLKPTQSSYQMYFIDYPE